MRLPRLTSRIDGLMTLAWTRQPARSRDLATILNGSSSNSAGITSWPRVPVLLRYAWLTVWTVRVLARRMPAVVIVQNPPVIPAFIAIAYRQLTGARVAIDAHPASFGAKGDRKYAVLQPVSRVVSRRAECTLVTVPRLAEVVEQWGGRPVIVHEPPITIPSDQPNDVPKFDVLYVSVFAADEPIWPVVDAAKLQPEVKYAITGDLSRAPARLREAAPPNLQLLGFLPLEEFYKYVAASQVIVSLSTSLDSVMRSAYEATYGEKPLITSSHEHLKQLFPFALHVEHSAEDIVTAVSSLLGDLETARAAAAEARTYQIARWHDQLSALSAHLGGESSVDS